MINKKIQNKLKSIEPTLTEYYEAKRLIERFEKNMELSKDILIKKFYVDMGFNFYSVGTFGGWDKNGNFLLKIEDVEPYSHIPNTHYISTELDDVFEKKQKDMLVLHAGVE